MAAQKVHLVLNDGTEHDLVLTFADAMRAEREGTRLQIGRETHPIAFGALMAWSAAKAARKFDAALPAEVFLESIASMDDVEEGNELEDPTRLAAPYGSPAN